MTKIIHAKNENNVKRKGVGFIIEKELEKELHWMKCPKCGSDMEEIEIEEVMIDKCKKCFGIYFDDGELELLISRQQSSSFLDKVRGFWK